MRPLVSASLMCANFLDLRSDLHELEQAGVDYLHMDMMDGHFVPNLMLPPDYVNAVGRASSIPLDVHLMVYHPESVIPLLNLKRCDLVSVHYESTPHVQRVLAMVRERGATPALAINPATPVECVRESLPDIGMVLVMTVNPGYSGQKLVPQCLDKVTRVRALLDDLGYATMPIQVDGNCSFEHAPRMRAAGADVFVVGSSSVFDPSRGIIRGTQEFRACIGE